jgi:diguanylate cyclase (GGDEF)-like protein
MPMTAREQLSMEFLVSGLQWVIVLSYCVAVFTGVLDVTGWWRWFSTTWVVAIQVPQLWYMLRYRARGRTVAWLEATIHFSDITAISIAWLAVGDPNSFIWVVYLYALVGYSRRLHGLAYALPAAFIVLNLLGISLYLNLRADRSAAAQNLVIEGVISICMALLAHMIGSAFLRAENRARILAETDPLTGIANRRMFLQKLEEYAEAADEASYSVLMLDLDNFKRLNDEFGHLAGDEALVRVAGTLKATLRGAGSVARYGGEEFIILLPGVRSDAASALAQELRRAVANDSPATVSVGCATRVAGELPATVVRRADDLLRLAKRSGKNTVRTDERVARSA